MTAIFQQLALQIVAKIYPTRILSYSVADWKLILNFIGNNLGNKTNKKIANKKQI